MVVCSTPWRVRKLYSNAETGWKSEEQEEALATVMSWTEQTVAILPTGAGKGLLVTLPCTVPEAGITILVIPLVSLHGDMLRRIHELNIDHLEWVPGDRREAALIIVSVEAVSTKTYARFRCGEIG